MFSKATLAKLVINTKLGLGFSVASVALKCCFQTNTGYCHFGKAATTIKLHISEHGGDQMICSDMRIIGMCESLQQYAYTEQGVPDFPIDWFHVYGACFSYTDQVYGGTLLLT